MTKFNLYDSAQDEFYRIAVEKGWIKVAAPVIENASSKSGLSKRAEHQPETPGTMLGMLEELDNKNKQKPSPKKHSPIPTDYGPANWDPNPPGKSWGPTPKAPPGEYWPPPGGNQQSTPGPVTPGVPTAAAPATPAAKKQGDPLVAKVQQKLKENKYNVGTHGADGKWGHDTQRAWDALIQKAKAQGINTTSIVGKRPSRQELQYFYANGVLATPNEGLRPNPYADDGAVGQKNNVVAAVDFTISHLTKIASALDNNGFAGLANIIDETIKRVAAKK
jgi:hypothetical protein